MGVTVAKSAIDLGIVTANGEAMLTFYRDLIGLKYVQQNPIPDGHPNSPGFGHCKLPHLN